MASTNRPERFHPPVESISSSSTTSCPMTPSSGDHDEKNLDSLSLTSSITDYPIENGRRYHRYREGSYLYPNDEPELDRQDMQYHLVKLINRGNIYFAPLSSPQRILDIGTGSGIWAIEMAEMFPNAEILGTDLSPIQPNDVPPNVHFYVDDAAEEDWLWPVDHFDHIHASILLGSLASFSDMLKTAFRYLKPGGYMECHEWDPICRCDDDTLPPRDPNFNSSYAFQNWVQYCQAGTKMVDRPLRIAHKIADWMREAGFVDVKEHVTKVPLNPWPKDKELKTLGLWSQMNWLDGLAGFTYTPFGPRGLGWTQEEMEVFMVDVRKSIKDRSVHTYQNFYVVTGRKPGL